MITKYYLKNKSYTEGKQGDIKMQAGIIHLNEGNNALFLIKLNIWNCTWKIQYTQQNIFWKNI